MRRLRPADCSAAGIHRRRRGRGFSFEDAQGTTITNEETLERIRGLAIPPAWKDVWICLDPVGHIQATGNDEAGGKQYRYHDRWDQRRASRKYQAMREFAAALPKLRRVVRRDIELEGMPRERALATAVRLLDLGFFRIGGEEYAESNESYGPATIRREHVHAAAALAGEEKPASEAAGKRTVNRAAKTVAAALDNTPAVCRRSYIDPRVFDRYRDGETIDVGRRAASEGQMAERTRQRIEHAVLELID